jgi:hypothetical protein
MRLAAVTKRKAIPAERMMAAAATSVAVREKRRAPNIWWRARAVSASKGKTVEHARPVSAIESIEPRGAREIARDANRAAKTRTK